MIASSNSTSKKRKKSLPRSQQKSSNNSSIQASRERIRQKQDPMVTFNNTERYPMKRNSLSRTSQLLDPSYQSPADRITFGNQYSSLQYQYEMLLSKYYELERQMSQMGMGDRDTLEHEQAVEGQLHRQGQKTTKVRQDLRIAYLKMESLSAQAVSDEQYIDRLEQEHNDRKEEAMQTIRIIAENRSLELEKDRLNEVIIQATEENLELQKDFVTLKNKCRQQDATIRNLALSKQQNQEDLQTQIQINQQEKLKLEQNRSEKELVRTLKMQIEKKGIQNQQLRDSLESQRARNDKSISAKEAVIKELRKQIQQTHENMDQMQESKAMEIKLISDKKKINQRELNSLHDQVEEMKHRQDIKESEIDQLNSQCKQIHNRFLAKGNEVENQRQEKQKLYEESVKSHKEISRLKISKGNLERIIAQEKVNYECLKTKVEYKQDELKLIRQEFSKLEERVQNLSEDNQNLSQQMEELKVIQEQQTKIVQTLKVANEQFRQNQQLFDSQMKEYESRLYEFECQQNSYAPRYDALMSRNQELDDKNRSLSDMVNKAIEIQADGYKKGILKTIEIDTNQIIQSVRHEQEFAQRHKRSQTAKHELRTPSLEDSPRELMLLTSQPQEAQNPYTQLSKERVSSHRNKVSESAKKLVEILELEAGSIGQKRVAGEKRYSRDYQQINSKMSQYRNQKEEVIDRISSFAERLKII